MSEPIIMRAPTRGDPVRVPRVAASHPAADILAPRSTDDEASAILDELVKLQHLMVMNGQRGREWMAAADLVQRTRILIIERCKRKGNVA